MKSAPRKVPLALVAKLAHEVNRAYREAIGEEPGPKWEELDAETQRSTQNGVIYRIAHPESTPRAMHANWSQLRIDCGWKYGPEKNIEKKEHPCLVPYAELPEAQRVKDNLFMAVVDVSAEIFDKVDDWITH